VAGRDRTLLAFDETADIGAAARAIIGFAVACGAAVGVVAVQLRSIDVAAGGSAAVPLPVIPQPVRAAAEQITATSPGRCLVTTASDHV
jgi:hypothetical protein